MSHSPLRIAIIGGGPAGLMAAETLALGGAQVDLYDAMPSVGRKFLLAGRGGLNLTHSEAPPAFIGRYGARATRSPPGWSCSAPRRCATGPTAWAWRPSWAARAASSPRK